MNTLEKEAEKLLITYWKRNWAIKAFADSLQVKEIGNHKWVKNPISNYWYSLRADKDKFSTINQSSGVYAFDLWITYLRRMGIKISLQMHDECLFNISPGKENIIKEKLDKAMLAVNEKLRLNVELGCSADFGNSYWSVH